MKQTRPRLSSARLRGMDSYEFSKLDVGTRFISNEASNEECTLVN